MTALTFLDVSLGERRPATQDDIDRMQQLLFALAVRNPPLPPKAREAFDFELACYSNPMRGDGVFVSERRSIEPYQGVRGLNGEPLYPAVPKSPYSLGMQLSHRYAAEIVHRWNRGP